MAFTFSSLILFGMGGNRRAEEREERLRAKLGTLHRIVIKWHRDDGSYFVDFLEPRSRLPLTRQRVYPSSDIIAGLVGRSAIALGHGPRRITFYKGLEAGFGEIEVEITGEQYAKLRASQ